jgi:hypothetical protein
MSELQGDLAGLGVMAELPEDLTRLIKNDLRVDFGDDYHSVVVTVGDRKFWRLDKRWRYKSGPYCGVHEIVKAMIDFENRDSFNMTNNQGRIFEFVVEQFGSAIDAACETISELRRQIIKQNGIPKPQVDYFSGQFNRNQCGTGKRTPYVYLMRHTNGLTKIGFSYSPQAREKTLQAEDPRLRLIATKQAHKNVETRLHRIFSDKRVRGEWFDLSNREVDWMRFLCGFESVEDLAVVSG